MVAVAAVTAALCAAPAGSDSTGAVALSTPIELEAGIPAGELEVVWGGELREPVEVAPLDPVEAPWRLLVYVDGPMATPEGIARALRLLGDQADELTRLGELELAVADPSPRRLLEPTRDTERARRVLAAALDEVTTAGELLWLRQRFVGLPFRETAEVSRARRAEEQLVQRQNERLAAWLERETGGDGARALLLVRDGYDLQTAAFYTGREASAPPETPAIERHERLERAVAGAGWRTLPLALGARHPELDDTDRALARLARATGGELIRDRASLRRTARRLARCQRLTFLAEGEAGEPRALEVRRSGRRRPLTAVRWLAIPLETVPRHPPDASAPSAPAIRLVPPEGDRLTGPLRVETLVAHRGVERVEFRLDGVAVARVAGPPWVARLDLGEEPRPRVLEAIAFGPGERRLGADRLHLDATDRRAELEILPLREDPSSGTIEVEVRASPPPGQRISAVEFYWNDDLAARRVVPPYRATLEVGRPAAGDYVRVVARLSDGGLLEGARLSRAAGPGDRLRVNLVEVFALVTDDDGRPRADLGREDFRLLQAGRVRAIEGFASAADLPLHLGLVVDSSASMTAWLDELRRAAARFLERVLSPADRAFLVEFNDRPRLVQPPTGDSELLVRRLGGLRARGDTVLYDAILFSLRQLEGVDGRKALVVLTDGVDEGSRFGSKRCISQARQTGVPVYVVKLGGAPDPHTEPFSILNVRLARQTGGRFHTLERLEELDAVYRRIEDELRSHYLLTFSTERALDEREWRAIEVEVGDPRLSVRTIPGARPRG